MYSLVSAKENMVKVMQEMWEHSNEIRSTEELQHFLEGIGEATIHYDIETKCSRYNYVAGNNGRYAVFNTVTGALYRFNEKEYHMYLGELPVTEEIKNEFIDAGLWVAADLDEQKRYLQYMNTCHCYFESNVNVVLSTTMKCNARCVYCYEAGVEHKDFPLDKLDDLVAFLKGQNLERGLQIIWFGGEPLLNQPLINALSEQLEASEINFSSYIITNGSLLTEDLIKNKLRAWHINDMQVTLDGTEEKYEQIKNYVDGQQGHFYPLLDKLALLGEEGIGLSIRLNISQGNLADMVDLVALLEERLGAYDSVSFYPAFVTGIEDIIPEEERIATAKRLLKVLKNPNKMTFANRFYEQPRVTSCHRHSVYAFSIDADGNVYTCEHYMGRPDQRIGDIWQGLYGPDTRGDKVELRPECQTCVFLPKCGGGCDANYDEGDIACMVEKYTLPAYLEYLLE